MSMTRKEFLGTVLTGAAALALVSACGDDDSPADAAAGNPDAAPGADAAPPSCTDNGAKAGTISGNHGHTLVVPAADVAGTAMDRTYSIQGSSAHDHMVTITAAQFTMLKAETGGFTVTATLGGGHMHTVTVVCA